MTDGAIIRKASAENWIIITNDKDFGEKVFRHGHVHKGLILLRLSDESASAKICTLSNLLENYSAKLPDSFVVATEKQVRFAKEYK